MGLLLFESTQAPKRTIRNGVHLGDEIKTVCPKYNRGLLILYDRGR